MLQRRNIRRSSKAREEQNGTPKKNQYPVGVCLGNGRNSWIASLAASLLMFVIVTSSMIVFIVVTICDVSTLRRKK
jgi:hypothetical protein